MSPERRLQQAACRGEAGQEGGAGGSAFWRERGLLIHSCTSPPPPQGEIRGRVSILKGDREVSLEIPTGFIFRALKWLPPSQQ